MSSTMRRSHIIIIFLLIVLLLILSTLGMYLHKLKEFSKTPLLSSKSIIVNQIIILPSVTFIVKPGMSITKIAWQLHDMGILQKPDYFIKLAILKGSKGRIQAGEYSIDPDTTPGQLLQKMTKGQVVLHKITFVEGWTFQQIIQMLNANPALKHTLANSTPAEIMQRLGHPGENPEGLFYPSTYLFKLNTSDSVILKIAYQLMQKKLQDAWHMRATNLPYTNSYQALIVASMVERESKLVNEKPLIAGVILKRLQKKMLLQIDATVIYGLGKDYNGQLTRADMRENTPYNTYLHKGLPPTPIAMPSLTSINAALHPIINNSLYYVAKGDGSHVFTETLQAHDRALF
jgi:UPF0755 protein